MQHRLIKIGTFQDTDAISETLCFDGLDIFLAS